MKISEDDLKDLFDTKDAELAQQQKGDQVTIRRVKKISEINKVRHSIKRIPQQKKHKQGDTAELINSLLRFTAVAGFCGFVIFVIMGWNGLIQQLKWDYFVNFRGERPPGITASLTPRPIPSPTPRPYASSEPVGAVSQLPSLHADFPANQLKVEKISITAPVAWEVPENDILERLKDGVAHYQGTSLPGQGGNVFIVGHSSNYFWVKSDYNNIFALLDKLSSGDRIEVSRNNVNYIYEVKETRIVKPDEVQVLENTPKETLSLMTCWPIGTSLKRMLVQSELVYSYSAD